MAAAAQVVSDRLDKEDEAEAGATFYELVPGCPSRPAHPDASWTPPCVLHRLRNAKRS